VSSHSCSTNATALARWPTRVLRKLLKWAIDASSRACGRPAAKNATGTPRIWASVSR
jgi:hypothetical protein